MTFKYFKITVTTDKRHFRTKMRPFFPPPQGADGA